MSGMITSNNTRSGVSSAMLSSACGPEVAVFTWYPLAESRSTSSFTLCGVSSTTKIFLASLIRSSSLRSLLDRLSCTLVDRLAHRRQELFHTDRLALIAIEARIDHALAILGHHRCSDGNHRDVPRDGVGGDALARLDAADVGQLNVHQYQRRHPLTRKPHAVEPVDCLHRLIAVEGEEIAHQLAALVIVFHDQNQFICHCAPACDAVVVRSALAASSRAVYCRFAYFATKGDASQGNIPG